MDAACLNVCKCSEAAHATARLRFREGKTPDWTRDARRAADRVGIAPWLALLAVRLGGGGEAASAAGEAAFLALGGRRTARSTCNARCGVGRAMAAGLAQTVRERDGRGRSLAFVLQHNHRAFATGSRWHNTSETRVAGANVLDVAASGTADQHGGHRRPEVRTINGQLIGTFPSAAFRAAPVHLRYGWRSVGQHVLGKALI